MGISSNRDNVVNLHTNRSSHVQNETPMNQRLSKLPASIQLIHDLSHTQFKSAIQNLFDHVDDSLFELADKAESNLEQNVFFESMREIRIHRRDMERSFLLNLDTHFVDVLSGCESDSSVEVDAEGVGVDDLSLVGKDELEEFVAVDSLVKKAWIKNKSALRLLGDRLNTVVAIGLLETNNPLTPRSITDSFVDASSVLKVDIKAKLVLFKLFDRYVIQELPNVLKVVNQSLTDQGISAPKPSMRSRASRTQNTGSHNVVKSNNEANVKNEAATVPDAAALYDTLQTLLQSQPQQESPTDFSDTAYANNASNDYAVTEVSFALINALSQIQQQQVQQGSSLNAARSGDLQPSLLSSSNIKTAIQSATGESLVDERSQDVMKLVDMLFSFILEDENLPDPIKLLLARLQIPFIKVALADDDFFKKEGHPARRLLNEMAMASIGWSGDNGAQKRDPLLTKIESTVARVLEEFDTNFELFTLLLTDFIAFIEKERRRVLLFEKRAIDAEAGKAKSEIGRKEVDKKLDELIRGKDIPETFKEFVKGPWSNILFLIYMRQGPESKQWTNALNIASELVWSALPIENDLHKNKLTSLLPRMDAALKKSLESISFNPAKQKQFLGSFHEHYRELFSLYDQKPDEESLDIDSDVIVDDITETHEANIEAITDKPDAKVSPAVQAEVTVDERVEKEQEALSEPAIDKPEVDSAKDGMVEEPLQQEVNHQESSPQVAQEPQKAEAQYINLVDNFTVGMWLEKQEDDVVSYRCRLAAVIRGAGKYIFVNRAGVKVAEETRETLALQLQQGKLKTLDDGMLFDRALESVITNLRSPK